jgi:integrase
MELRDIKTPRVRAWNAALKKLHKDTAAQAYRLLHAIFNTAVEDDLLTHNPCKVKGATHFKNPERNTAQVEEITAAVDSCEERFRLSIALAAWCQLRPHEILGLRRKHVDFTNGCLHIEDTWTSSDGKM